MSESEILELKNRVADLESQLRSLSIIKPVIPTDQQEETAELSRDFSSDHVYGGSNVEERPEFEDWPEAFRVVYDLEEETYKIENPIVCTPSGQINATGADNLSAGSYYCKVSNESGTFSAEITDSSDTDENTVVIVPIADITENDGIHQKHIGTIIVNESKEYIEGDDTNIVFTPVTSGSNKGKIKIDVYYK